MEKAFFMILISNDAVAKADPIDLRLSTAHSVNRRAAKLKPFDPRI
jgi:hypothetical protein